MTEHVPSTTDIRIRYERYREQEQQRGAGGVTPVTPGEFERWYADEFAAAEQRGAERGWDEGWDASVDAAERCTVAGGDPCGECAICRSPNPYRADEIERTP